METTARTDGLTADMLPEWHEAAIDALDYPLGWKEGGNDPEGWKRRGLDAFRSLLLETAVPRTDDFDVIASERRDGYRVDLIELALGRFRRSRAYLAIPDSPAGAAGYPAALLLHDHGAFFKIGKEKMIRPFRDDPKTADAVDWAERNYGGVFVGDDLARRGWVVFAADALGWGDRVCGGYESQQAIASNLFNIGSSWAGLIAQEDIAAAAFLAALPDVDAGRVVSIGHSMGGHRSWQVASLSEDVKAAAVVCSAGTIKGIMAPGGNRTRGQSAFSMTHPGLSRLMDLPDAMALAAPKPIIMIHGTEDRLFPVKSVEDAYAKIRSVYRAFGAERNFSGTFRKGGHSFDAADQETARVWLSGIH